MDQAIVDKIRKLLALATSSNEHEARLAAEKANELLICHNLKMQGLEEDSYCKKLLADFDRIWPEERFVELLLTEHFFVRPIRCRSFVDRKTNVYLVGEKSNVEISVYVYGFLSRAFRDLWNEYRRKTGCSIKSRRSYWSGLYEGLDQQLCARRRAVEKDMALMVIPDPNLNRAAENYFGCINHRILETTDLDPVAYLTARAQGKKLNIRQGISECDDGPVRQIEGTV